MKYLLSAYLFIHLTSLPSMRPIFAAAGPAFMAAPHPAPAVRNVDVYPLLCALLGVRPAPNNGTLKILKPYLLV
jgi:hypothetical protein